MTREGRETVVIEAKSYFRSDSIVELLDDGGGDVHVSINRNLGIKGYEFLREYAWVPRDTMARLLFPEEG